MSIHLNHQCHQGYGLEFTKNIAESFTKGQSYADRIAIALSRNQINSPLKDATKRNVTNYKEIRYGKKEKCQFYKYIISLF